MSQPATTESMLAVIPPSDSAVDVSIIDTTGFVGKVPINWCMKPQIGALKHLSCPCYSFLIHHQPSNTRLLFDLGLRKDFETGFPPAVWDRLKNIGLDIRAPEDVSEILTANNVPLDSINAIIWSHHHWDHIGDPSKFPPSTSIIVGPGFKKEFLPVYGPEAPDSLIPADALDGRELIEYDFQTTPSSKLTIGSYPAIDYFGDGSFYLLDTPGHTIGHVSALARTSKDSFIFMGGDIAHHPGEYRPSTSLPLPDQITPDPRHPPTHPSFHTSFCPGDIFTSLHPSSSAPSTSSSSPSLPSDPKTTPFFLTATAQNLPLAQSSVNSIPLLDGNPDVFTVIAHDDSLRDIVELFPKSANGWKEKGWREKGVWRFLGDFFVERGD